MEYLKKNKGVVILIIGFLALIVYNFGDFSKTFEPEASEYSEILVSKTTQVEIDNSNYIMVDIKGEVTYPGLYQVTDDMRLGGLINIAGGATSKADLSNINLAIKLIDEMNVTIPAVEETIYVPADIVKIKVEIKGCVNYPGVYILYVNSRVSDLIEEAGGLTEFANTDSIQQAKILQDGETVSIPEQIVPENTETVLEERKVYIEVSGEVMNPGVYLIPETYSVKDLIYEAGGVTVNCDLEKINWDITLCLGASLHIPSYEDEYVEEETSSDKININKADLEKLVNLTGIGQILGQRIIDYRAEYGDFLSIEEVMYVSGIKSSIYEEIKESITV